MSPHLVPAVSALGLSPFMLKDRIEACCPSCGQRTTFTLIGEQRWPREVAKLLGLPHTVRLYLCGSCESTISEPNLRF
jgi:hypothetical protein